MDLARDPLTATTPVMGGAQNRMTADMPLSDLITPASVLPSLKAATKKQALLEIAEAAAGLTGMAARDIFDNILQRERLGSTGIGDGVAIPHCKLTGLTRLHGLFARAERPIDFDALDGQPVDLIFLLMAPEHAGADHLKALARVARVLREPGNLQRLRATRDAEGLHRILTPAPLAA